MGKKGYRQNQNGHRRDLYLSATKCSSILVMRTAHNRRHGSSVFHIFLCVLCEDTPFFVHFGYDVSSV